MKEKKLPDSYVVDRRLKSYPLKLENELLKFLLSMCNFFSFTNLNNVVNIFLKYYLRI